MNSDKPGEEYAKVFNDYAKKNGFNGRLIVTYDERLYNSYNRREFKIKMEFEENVKTSLLKFVGISEVPIKVVIDGAGHKQRDFIWKPRIQGYQYYTATYENGKKIN
ncbi:hypothetical protein ABGF38_00715 [Helcococcus ovis]|uniref:hypothetical protein n=1 Tax=Helcococcus ovis TaxID=72026 RepID=UPI0038BD356A